MYLVIELSNTKVKATLVAAKTKAVKHFVARDLGEGVVQNGYINKPEEFESTLRLTLTDFPKTKGCIFLLNTSDILQKELTVPAAKPAAVKTVVQNQMSALLQSGKEYSIDYVEKETFKDAEGASFIKVLAYAAPVPLLQTYTGVAKNVGIKLLGIDVQHSAFNKAISGASINNVPLAGGNSLVMLLEHDALKLFLVEQGQCTYSRNVDFNTKEYLEAMKQVDQNASFENISLSPMYKAQFGQIQNILDPMTGMIIDQIFGMQQYTYSRQDIQPITNVFILGPLADINGMAEYLNANVDIPVSNVQSISTLNIEGSVSMADALIPSGAAETKNSINLAASIPGMFDDVSVGTGNELKILVPIAIAVIAIVAGVYLFFLVSNNTIKNNAQKLRDQMQESSYVEALSQAQQLEKDNATYRQNIDYLSNFLDQFDENSVYKSDVVKNILLVGVEKGIDFQEISYAEGELTLFGVTTDDQELIAPEYAKALKSDPRTSAKVVYVVYSGEKLEAVGEEKDEQGNLLKAGEDFYTFTVVVGLKERAPETSEGEEETTAAAEETSEDLTANM
jgi:Tfp pilus assembly PilM family ATPase